MLLSRALLISFVAAGCATTSTTSAPLRTLRASPTATSCVLVMLPGIGDSPEKFRRYGFEAAAHSADAPCDTVLVDAPMAVYRNPEQLPQQLSAEVLEPLRSRYRQVWLVGVSLGGYGAVRTAAANPGLVDGVVLISPWLGVPQRNRAFLERVEGAGGLALYDGPFAMPRSAQDHLVQTGPAWAWLQQRAQGKEGPQLVLAYGAQDRFVANHLVLADSLDEGAWLAQPGGHSWDVFGALFREVARRAPWHG